MRRADGSLSQRQRVPTASPVAYLGPLWGWGPGGSGVYLLFELDLIRRNYSVLVVHLAGVVVHPGRPHISVGRPFSVSSPFGRPSRPIF